MTLQRSALPLFFFSSRRRHTRFDCDWSSDVCSSDLKCFRRRVLEAIDLSRVRSNGYAFQIEMSVRAWRKGFTLKEVPIVFVDRTEGQSKMNRGIVREAVWMVPRLRLMVWFGRI